MKAILMSIKPKWCEKIFSREKTIEVRKTAPKLKPPFKVYVYESIGQGEGAGAVVGEFVCRAVEKYDIDLGGDYYRISDKDSIQTCLNQNLLFKYGNGRDLYGWHISDLKIYDKPRELGEFRNSKGEQIKRPFQSWGYIND